MLVVVVAAKKLSTGGILTYDELFREMWSSVVWGGAAELLRPPVPPVAAEAADSADEEAELVGRAIAGPQTSRSF